jgi:hypothetical protein
MSTWLRKGSDEKFFKGCMVREEVTKEVLVNRERRCFEVIDVNMYIIEPTFICL